MINKLAAALRTTSIVLFAWACLSGGAGADVNIEDPDIGSLADWSGLLEEARPVGQQDRELLLRSATVVPRGTPAYELVDATLAEVETARRTLLGRADEGKNFATSLRTSLLNAPLNVTIVVTETPAFARTFPDTSVVVSRELVETSDPWSRRFVMAHELVHLRDGHAVMNWVALQGRSRSNSMRAGSLALSVLSIWIESEWGTDLGSVTYNNRGSRYDVLAHRSVFFEFLADYWAHYIVKEMGAPSGASLAALSSIAQAQGALDVEGDGVRFGHLRDRIGCMERLDIADTEGAAADDAYWSCALGAVGQRDTYRTQFENAEDRREDREFDDWDDPYSMPPMPSFDERARRWDYRLQAIMSDAGAMRRTQAFEPVVDGIPITLAGDAFRAERALPDLAIVSVRAEAGEQTLEGYKVLRVRLRNGGRRAASAPFFVGLGQRSQVGACASAFGGGCQRIGAPLAVGEERHVVLFLPLDLYRRVAADPEVGIAAVACPETMVCELEDADPTNNWAVIEAQP